MKMVFEVMKELLLDLCQQIRLFNLSNVNYSTMYMYHFHVLLELVNLHMKIILWNFDNAFIGF